MSRPAIAAAGSYRTLPLIELAINAAATVRMKNRMVCGIKNAPYENRMVCRMKNDPNFMRFLTGATLLGHFFAMVADWLM